MSSVPRIVLLGATGKLGRHILRSLISPSSTLPNVDVTIIVRDRKRVTLPSLSSSSSSSSTAANNTVFSDTSLIKEENDPDSLLKRINIIEGDINDRTLLRSTIEGCHTCIMTAGRPDEGTPSSLEILFKIVVETIESLHSSSSSTSSSIPQLLCMGGMGILDTPHGNKVYQLPFFPAAPRGFSLVHEKDYALLQAMTNSRTNKTQHNTTSNYQRRHNWTMFCPGFMDEENIYTPNVPTNIVFNHAPFYDPKGTGGSYFVFYHPSLL